MTRTPTISCAGCSRPMWSSNGRSLPQGEATCHSCRRARRAAQPARTSMTYERRCATCGATFTAKRANARYCPAHRRTGSAANTTRRGYGAEHQAKRKEWQPYVDAGQVECHAAVCFMPTRLIQPGTAWDLGHTPDRTAWTGPEHRYCNRKEPQLRAPGTTPPRREPRRRTL